LAGLVVVFIFCLVLLCVGMYVEVMRNLSGLHLMVVLEVWLLDFNVLQGELVLVL
jgi:hypothetical protein